MNFIFLTYNKQYDTIYTYKTKRRKNYEKKNKSRNI